MEDLSKTLSEIDKFINNVDYRGTLKGSLELHQRWQRLKTIIEEKIKAENQ